MNDSHIILIKKIADGDKEALKQFFTEYGGYIKSVADRILNDKALCDDVLNDVLLKIWDNADKIKKCSNILGYIYTITYNLAIDIKRKQKDIYCEDEKLPQKPNEYSDSNEKIYIDSILSLIDEPYRSILILKANLQFNFYEISKIKNISYKQARNYYIKAAKMFEDLYKRN